MDLNISILIYLGLQYTRDNISNRKLPRNKRPFKMGRVQRRKMGLHWGYQQTGKMNKQIQRIGVPQIVWGAIIKVL